MEIGSNSISASLTPNSQQGLATTSQSKHYSANSTVTADNSPQSVLETAPATPPTPNVGGLGSKVDVYA